MRPDRRPWRRESPNGPSAAKAAAMTRIARVGPALAGMVGRAVTSSPATARIVRNAPMSRVIGPTGIVPGVRSNRVTVRAVIVRSVISGRVTGLKVATVRSGISGRVIVLKAATVPSATSNPVTGLKAVTVRSAISNLGIAPRAVTVRSGTSNRVTAPRAVTVRSEISSRAQVRVEPAQVRVPARVPAVLGLVVHENPVRI